MKHARASVDPGSPASAIAPGAARGSEAGSLRQPARLPEGRAAEGIPVGDFRHALDRVGRWAVAPVEDRAEIVADVLGPRIESRMSRGGAIAAVPVRPNRPAVTRSRSELAAGPGRRPADDVRHAAEHEIGTDLSNARVHEDLRAQTMTALLGARALTHVTDIFLGEQAATAGGSDLAHELAHVGTAPDDHVYLRRATWVERRGWLAFFDHYLPRKFLNNYMDDTGTAITLTRPRRWPSTRSWGSPSAGGRSGGATRAT